MLWKKAPRPQVQCRGAFQHFELAQVKTSTELPATVTCADIQLQTLNFYKNPNIGVIQFKQQSPHSRYDSEPQVAI